MISQENFPKIIDRDQVLELPNRADQPESSTISTSYPNLYSLNPHPCGFLGDQKREWVCNYQLMQRYRSKISGPLMDRIDIQIYIKSLRDFIKNCLPAIGEKGYFIGW